MPWIEKEGRTVDEARAAAISEAGVSEEELEVEVLHEGARGLFGLGGEPAIVRVRPRDEGRDVRGAFRDELGTPREAREAPPAAEPGPAAEPADAAPATSAPAAGTDVEEAGEGLREDEGQPQSERQEVAATVGEEMIRGVLERMGLEGEVTTRVSGGTVYVEVFGEGMGILIGRGGATLEALQELVRAGVQRRLQTRQPIVVDVESYWARRRGRRRGSSGGGGRRSEDGDGRS